MRNIALIVAAGKGERLGGEIPKQYLPLGNKFVISYSIERFLEHPNIDDVVIVVNPIDQRIYRKIFKNYNLLKIVAGGESRKESVLNGLVALENIQPDNVLIHDAARPFVTEGVISNVLEKLQTDKAVLPVVAIEDTVKQLEDGRNIVTLNRANLFRAQTPQGFNYSSLLEKHKKLNKSVTDDASIFEIFGENVATSIGSQRNYKITNYDDYERAERDIAEKMTKEIRSGIGYDVHQMKDDEGSEGITLGGVMIFCDKKIIAHSDGDVLIHAVVDALLGALSCGDIGDHFPPEDVKFKNMNSEIFLKETLKILEEKKAKIINLDLTVICEAPKLKKYKEEIKNNMARILKIENNRVNIKATTTEKLGSIGREEGIAVTAIANISI